MKKIDFAEVTRAMNSLNRMQLIAIGRQAGLSTYRDLIKTEQDPDIKTDL